LSENLYRKQVAVGRTHKIRRKHYLYLFENLYRKQVAVGRTHKIRRKHYLYLSETLYRKQVGVRYVHLVRLSKCINWMRQNTNASIFDATNVLQ